MVRPSSAAQGSLLAIAAVAIGVLPAVALAEEGGSGHYLPGSMASFIDVVPPTETFLARLNSCTTRARCVVRCWAGSNSHRPGATR
jgi:hypothetical protein